MKATAGVGVAAYLRSALYLPRQLQVVFDTVLEIIWVHEILARVIWRINVDSLHLSCVTFLQELQHFQVVSFDHQILRSVPVQAIL